MRAARYPVSKAAGASRFLLAAFAVALLTVVGPPSIGAEDPADEVTPSELLSRLELDQPGNWKGVYDHLRGEDPARRQHMVEAVLTPVFSPDSAIQTKEHRRALRLELAKLLLEDLASEEGAVPDVPQVAAALVDWLARTPEAVAELRKQLAIDVKTDRARAWDALLLLARDLLRAERPVADAALVVMGYEGDDEHAPDVFAMVRQQQLATVASGRGPSEDAFLALYERLWQRRFADLASVHEVLGGLDDELTAWRGWASWNQTERLRVHRDLLRAAARQSLGASQVLLTDYERVLELLKTFVGRLTAPEAFAPYWGKAETRFFKHEELQRAAMTRAIELAPEPTPEWIEVMTSVLDHVEDAEVLRGAFEILGGWTVKDRAPTADLAASIVERLATREDALPEQERLVGLLSVFGTNEHVQKALESARAAVQQNGVPERRAAQQAIYIALIGNFAKVTGARVADLVADYDGRDGKRPDVAVRKAVVEAMRLQGVRQDTPAAWKFLERVALPPAADPDPGVRQAAVRNLGFYAEPAEAAATADVLRRVVEGVSGPDDPRLPEAREAISALVRHVRIKESEAAARALASLLDAEAGVPALRAAVLTELARAAEAKLPPPVRAEVCGAVRAVLDQTTSDEVRTLAAQCLVEFADVDALPRFEQFRAEAAAAEAAAEADSEARKSAAARHRRWAEAQAGLVRGLAAAGAEDPAIDRRLAQFLLDLTPTARARVEALLAAMGPAADRPAFQIVRAAIQFRLGGDDQREPAARITSYDGAFRIAGEALARIPSDTQPGRDDRKLLHLLQFDAMTKQAALLLEAQDTAREASALLQAAEVASASGNERLARHALQFLPRIEPALTDEQKPRFEALRTELETLAGNGGG